jgi:SprT-like family
VLLTFTRHARMKGHYDPRKWKKGETVTAELSINPQMLTALAPDVVVSTVVHEMTHHWQQICGHPPKRPYHNREWANKMESIGLMPSNTGLAGGKRTGSSVSHYIIDSGPFQVAFEKMPREYLLPWLSLEQTPAEKPKKDPSKTRYTCPACGINTWGKPDLNLLCIDCQQPLEMVTTGGRP